MRFKLLITLVLTGLSMMAMPADPTPNKISQPDGTTLTLRLLGDEFYHFNTTIDGYTVLKNANGGYEYAVSRNRSLMPSGTLAHDPELRTAAELAILEATPRYITDQTAITQSKAKRLERDTQQAPLRMTTQGFRGLLVLINYTDKKFQMTDPNSFYEQMICQKGYTGFNWNNRRQACPGSFRDYFNDQSFNQFDPVFDIAGPVEVDFGCKDVNSTSNAWRIFFDALDKLDATLDFSNYDNDGDGYIDMVYFIVAGYSANYSGNNSGYLWPHKSYLYDYSIRNYRKYDGVTMALYASSTEIYGWESQGSTMPLGIGTMCHEFTHVLGLPDLYDTDYESNGQSNHPGTWDIMAGGGSSNYGRTPCNYSIWERYALGWAQPTELNQSGIGSYTLRNVATTGDGFILRSPVNKEFFMLDNRQRSGWDAYLPGHGMLVARVDSTNAEVWRNNTVNANPSHNYYELIRAGKGASNASDPFPGTSNITELNNLTDPALLTWAKLGNDFGLSNIKESNGVITFDLVTADQLTSITEDFETMPVTTDKNASGVQGQFTTWDFRNALVTQTNDQFKNGEKMAAMYTGSFIAMTKPVYNKIYNLNFSAYNPSSTTAKLMVYVSYDNQLWTQLTGKSIEVPGKSGDSYTINATLTGPAYFRFNMTAGSRTVPCYIDNIIFYDNGMFDKPTGGDINGDGKVDIEDLNGMINAVLVGATDSVFDVDGDGKVDVQDINTLINILLGL